MKLRALGVLRALWNNGLIKGPWTRAICVLLVYSTSKSTHLYSIPGNFLIRQVYIQAGLAGLLRPPLADPLPDSKSAWSRCFTCRILRFRLQRVVVPCSWNYLSRCCRATCGGSLANGICSLRALFCRASFLPVRLPGYHSSSPTGGAYP
jgi:hypothetical protein